MAARTLGLALYVCALAYLNAGDRTRTDAVWQELAELAQRTGDTDLLLRSLTTEIDAALLDGELEAAVVATTHVRDRGDELGAPVTGRLFASARGCRPLLYLNRADETLEALPEARLLAGIATEQGGTGWNRRSQVALALAYLGRSDEARAVINQLLTELRVASEEHVMTTTAGVTLLETAVLIKDREAAALLASRLQPVASLACGGLAFTSVARHLGAAAALLGDREAARAYYEQALELCGRLRFRPEIALTHLGIAELLLDEGVEGRASRVGEGTGTSLSLAGEGEGEGVPGSVGARHAVPSTRAEALQHLDFAIGEFRAMKMQPALEQALRHKDVLGA